MLSQPAINSKRLELIQKYGAVMWGYAAAALLWSLIIVFVLVARAWYVLWEPTQFLLVADYYIAYPAWVVGYPALWLAHELGQRDGFGLLLVEFSLLLILLARLISLVRSPWLQTALAFGLSFILFSLIVWQIFQLYTPIAMDELF